jgi:Tfp pilus assembly protein FimT
MKRANAFSLIETTAVVFILGTIMAVAMPRYTNSLCSYRAAMAANKLAADLTLARNDAFASGSHRTVTFTQATNQYTLTGIPDPNFKNNANTVVCFTGDPYYVTLGSSTFTGNTFTFDGYGMPSAGGQITVTAGNYTKTILVDATSGKVTVQ